MDSKTFNVYTQDGLVTRIEDSNWNEVKVVPAHVAKVASAISGVTDGLTEVSVVNDSDHVPYAMAYVRVTTVGSVSTDIGLLVECFIQYSKNSMETVDLLWAEDGEIVVQEDD